MGEARPPSVEAGSFSASFRVIRSCLMSVRFRFCLVCEDAEVLLEAALLPPFSIEIIAEGLSCDCWTSPSWVPQHSSPAFDSTDDCPTRLLCDLMTELLSKLPMEDLIVKQTMNFRALLLDMFICIQYYVHWWPNYRKDELPSRLIDWKVSLLCCCWCETRSCGAGRSWEALDKLGTEVCCWRLRFAEEAPDPSSIDSFIDCCSVEVDAWRVIEAR